MEKSYYEVLGVPQNADSLTIKKAYKSLVKKYHPDIYKGEDRDERFKEIQKAYDVLSDESKRAKYDNVGHTSYSNQEKYSNGYSYRDVNGFNDFKGYANVKFKSFSDLKWYTKILIIIAIILGFFLLLIVGLIFLIIYLIKFIIALFTGASRSE